MNDNIVDGIHLVQGNAIENQHSCSNNVRLGMHVQTWFGDRFISGIQDEDGNFILDKIGKIILEE